MPASPDLPDPTPQLAALQTQLRRYAVWRAEGSERPAPGEWQFERFLAVIEDEHLLMRYARQVQEIEQAYRDAKLLLAPERRMPALFNEVWDHCAMHVNQAWESHRVREFKFPLEGSATADEWPAIQAKRTSEYAQVIRQLQDLGLKVVEVRGVQLAPGGPISPTLYLEARRSHRFTVRRSTGSAYRLHATTTEGELRKNVRVGVVVIRGLLHRVHEHHPPRKVRKDKLPPGVPLGKFEVVVPE
ncbi:hypothetical protein DEIPH_ctg139orf0158 [Deinococcus phoenicis]|uniref:Uncharacterized protein n=1 Tax=Deinococcus phoenicis TaxID=1476583 RepID=A0A016QKL4_9DEIO|nr:hypothetical protein [Deinococcus phoenicis]EYB66427.1 hypothetical protein DEIPH_ctg139orf0158 [Deinococcus phoenicis]